ncbi:MAG: hypothetical protein GY854_35390 [Deltaproteobacteria bacterium]|nr:hypothetical protein [Deltaproteobacteria bacterium]
MISQVSSVEFSYLPPTTDQRASETDRPASETDQEKLTEKEHQKVEKLKARDQEVRQHERAHLAAGGAYVRGGASYTFERGPDNKQYAAGGEVSIDTSQGKTPEETIQKAQVIRRAALAPANPSAQDRSVAAKASAMETDARKKLAEEQQEEVKKTGGQVDQAAEETSPPQDLNARIATARAGHAYNPGTDKTELTREPPSVAFESFGGVVSLDMAL